MMSHGASAEATIDRRTLLRGAAAAVAGGGLTTALAWPEAARGDDDEHRGVLPAPKPIPGGLQIPGGPLIHVFLPGPEDVTLPFTGSTLQGLDVEPVTISDFKGAAAMTYLVGQATGARGKKFNVEVDLRVAEGRYVAENGERRRGTFAMI